MDAQTQTQTQPQTQTEIELTLTEKILLGTLLVALPAAGFAAGRWLAPECHCPVSQTESAEAHMG